MVRRSASGSRAKPAPAPAYVTRRVPPYEILREGELVAIEAAADRILSEIGVEVRDDPPSLEAFRAAGASVEGTRVRFDPGFCREVVRATTPRSFTQHARNPARSVLIGDDAVVFTPAYGPPFVRARDIERRYATQADFETVVKLTYLLPQMHHSGGTVCEPVDVPVEIRHLDMVHAHLRLSDMPFMGSVTSGERAADSIRMAEMAFEPDFLRSNCVIMGLVNLNSPLALDGTMLAALRTYAAAGQGVVVSPFVIAGAAGPVTPAGILAQSLAETLAGLALTQLIRPGAPAVFGYLSTGLNMRTGAPVRYDETWTCFLAAGQLARRLGVPFRCGSTTTSAKTPDYQAGLESAMSFQAAFHAGAHLMIHASGNVENGLCLDLDKLILDAEILGMAARFAGGIDVSGASLAVDALAETGPGGNFLGTDHVLARYRDAFYEARTFDGNSFEQWRDEGRLDATERAAVRRREMLAGYQPPPLDPAIADAIEGFVRKRKTEIGGSA